MTTAAKLDYWTDWVGWWTARSFVGVFGYMDVFLLDAPDMTWSDTTYRVAILCFLAIAAGWGFSLRSGLDGPSKAVVWTHAALLLVVFLLFVRFNLQYFQGQARYLYPAIGPITIGLAGGLCHLLGRHKLWAWVVVAALLACLQILAFMALNLRFGSQVS